MCLFETLRNTWRVTYTYVGFNNRTQLLGHRFVCPITPGETIQSRWSSQDAVCRALKGVRFCEPLTWGAGAHIWGPRHVPQLIRAHHIPRRAAPGPATLMVGMCHPEGPERVSIPAPLTLIGLDRLSPFLTPAPWSPGCPGCVWQRTAGVLRWFWLSWLKGGYCGHVVGSQASPHHRAWPSPKSQSSRGGWIVLFLSPRGPQFREGCLSRRVLCVLAAPSTAPGSEWVPLEVGVSGLGGK